MRDKGELASAKDSWTRAEDYFASMARRRTARRSRTAETPRTTPEAPRFLLSTLPVIALIAGLAMLSIAIAVDAWPGLQQAQPAKAKPEPRELGTAPKGWFEEAKKEFH